MAQRTLDDARERITQLQHSLSSENFADPDTRLFSALSNQLPAPPPENGSQYNAPCVLRRDQSFAVIEIPPPVHSSPGSPIGASNWVSDMDRRRSGTDLGRSSSTHLIDIRPVPNGTTCELWQPPTPVHSTNHPASVDGVRLLGGPALPGGGGPVSSLVQYLVQPSHSPSPKSPVAQTGLVGSLTPSDKKHLNGAALHRSQSFENALKRSAYQFHV